MQPKPAARDKQCDEPVALCGLCGGETYREDVLYIWEGKYICTLCMEEKFDALTSGEKAQLLGAYAIRGWALNAEESILSGITGGES